VSEAAIMAKQTRGKRTRSKTELKTAPAGRRRLSAKTRGAFPGGASKTGREVGLVVPRVTRS
jgi:hypothetical protein